MKDFMGEDDQLLRFVLLACGLLTLAGAVACLILGNALLAIACSIVSAWAIGYFLDTLIQRIASARRFESSRQSARDQHED